MAVDFDQLDSPLPNGDPEPFQPLKYGFDSGFVVGIADTHFGFHDRKLIEYQINFAKRLKAKMLVLMGDAFDFHGLSRFDKYFSHLRASEELKINDAFWSYAREQLGRDCELAYLPGNHCERWDKTIVGKIPELKDVEGLRFEKVCGLDRHGVAYAADRVGIEVNDLLFLHGHEIEGRGGSSEHPAKNALKKVYRNVAIGHHHVSDEFHVRAMGGKQLSAYVVGCSCNLRPKWARAARWSHGMLVGKLSPGSVRVKNVRIDF